MSPRIGTNKHEEVMSEDIVKTMRAS